MVKAQEWLDQNYPTKEGREKVAVLKITGEGLQGHLDLRDFVNLTIFSADNLEEITITNAPKLTDLYIKHDLPLSILDNIHGLENTSLIRFDIRGILEKKKDKKLIWDTLIKVRRKFYPEMALIDISDLEELVKEVNEKSDGGILEVAFFSTLNAVFYNSLGVDRFVKDSYAEGPK